MTIVTLTTDFGTRDGYVGEMKGVLLDRAPAARVVDVTHAVPAGDPAAGSWVLGRIWSRFPEGTVHLAVIDPGVGSERRAVAARIRDRWLVAPDNGLLTDAALSDGCDALRELDPDRVGLDPLSDTFHGRDLFAPAAAHLAAGGEPSGLGPGCDPAGAVRLELAPARRDGGLVHGEVRHVDRFGNLITNVPVAWLPERPTVRIGDYRIEGLSRSFAAVETGQPVLIAGSGGTLEVCVRGASARETLGMGRGATLTVASGGRDSAAGPTA